MGRFFETRCIRFRPRSAHAKGYLPGYGVFDLDNFRDCHHFDTHSWNSNTSRAVGVARLVDGSRSAIPVKTSILHAKNAVNASLRSRSLLRLTRTNYSHTAVFPANTRGSARPFPHAGLHFRLSLTNPGCSWPSCITDVHSTATWPGCRWKAWLSWQAF